MTPDEAAFKAHVEEPPFLEGIDRGKWGLHGVTSAIVWPIATIWVGADAKPGWPDRFFFRFDLAGYPNQAPTAGPWDIGSNARLPNDRWPRGPRFVSKVFNPGWNGGVALYLPCDRLAMNGHDHWKSVHPGDWWQPSHTIVKYLTCVYQLLHLQDYVNG